MEGNVKAKPRVVEMKGPGNDDQMGGAGDRQKFPESLDNTEDNGLEVCQKNGHCEEA